MSQRVLSLYEAILPGIDEADFEVSISAVRERIAGLVDSISLENVHFIPPPETTVPLPLNEDVERNIVYLTTKGRRHFKRWLERSGKYFPMMREIFREEGVPQELLSLSMIESGLNPTARSWAHCVGLWQFLKSTGELYGLEGDWWCDDRRDPEKSTRAAARHLKDLYNRYNDWHLALAAYNAGPGRIDRALRRYKGKNPTFWDIKNKLPKETRNYVPIYIAATLLTLNAQDYGFTDVQYQDTLDYEIVYVDGMYDLDTLASRIDVPVTELRDLNPHILQEVTPPNRKHFPVRVPVGKAELLRQQLASIPVSSRPQYRVHIVKRRETLYAISRKYKVSISTLARVNHIKARNRLRIGQRIMVPIPSSALRGADIAKAKKTKVQAGNGTSKQLKRTRGRTQLVHAVKRGETLGRIARKYHVRISDLMAWNAMESGDIIRTGDELVVWIRKKAEQNPGAVSSSEIATAQETTQLVPTRRYHRIRAGETLSAIAGRYNVSVDELKEWNDLKGTSIKAGKLLQVGVLKGNKGGAEGTPSRRVQETAAVPPRGSADAVTHVVRKGESLGDIAGRYSVSTSQLRTWNSLSGDLIKAGQSLVIRTSPERDAAAPKFPATSIPDAKPAAGDERPATYTVEHGDNLFRISQEFHVTVDDLVKWNNLESSVINAGVVLKLHPPGTVKEEFIYHTVRRGETLYAIAGKYGVAVREIRQLNGLKNGLIRVGVKLKIPAVGSNETASVNRTSPLAKTYVVKKGDTLFSISRALEVSIEDLKKWNKLDAVLPEGKILLYY
ncbi:MAG: LysM peptidoglycan-binding domain-containing protein [Chlorobi bacterium]|nr:LysM peptidoglycan-binding domain-containing protein [Chlorobiota bacterium]